MCSFKVPVTRDKVVKVWMFKILTTLNIIWNKHLTLWRLQFLYKWHMIFVQTALTYFVDFIIRFLVSPFTAMWCGSLISFSWFTWILQVSWLIKNRFKTWLQVTVFLIFLYPSTRSKFAFSKIFCCCLWKKLFLKADAKQPVVLFILIGLPE